MLLRLPTAPVPRPLGWLERAWRVVLARPRTVRATGVTYTPRAGRSLLGALAEREHVEFDARFADAPNMRVRCSVDRPYADLLGPCVLDAYRPAEPLIRPGDRVLDPRARTGAGAAWLAERVGPSGAVVAIDPDNESVRFARRRYPCANVAFELGALGALAGEPEGAFDAIVAIGALPEGPGERTLLEWWRVVRPGGVLYIAEPGAGALRPSPHATRLEPLVREITGADASPVDPGGLPMVAVRAQRPEDA